MMAQASASQAIEHDRRLFWGCFIALIATSFGFIARVLTADAWGTELGLTATQVGEILGVGLWPFAISIILFSLIIDTIGYNRGTGDSGRSPASEHAGSTGGRPAPASAARPPPA